MKKKKISVSVHIQSAQSSRQKVRKQKQFVKGITLSQQKAGSSWNYNFQLNTNTQKTFFTAKIKKDSKI